MGVKKSVMINEQNAELIKEKFNGEWSYAVNRQFDLSAEKQAIIHRLASELLPDLTMDEWQLILNAYNGTFLDEIHKYPPYRLATAVMEDNGVELLDTCQPEFQEAVRKIAGLSQPEQFAIAEFTRWFWQDDKEPVDNFMSYIQAFKNACPA